MSFKLATAFVELTTRDTGLNRGLDSAQNKLRNAMSAMQGIAAATATAFVGGRIIASMIDASAQAEEISSKFAAVFKEQTDSVREFAVAFASEVNRGVIPTMKKLGDFQDLFVAMEFDRPAAAEMSKTLVRLTEDLASFRDERGEDVALALTSGLIGEAEPVRRFGAIITQVALNQELLNMNIAGGVKEATNIEKVLARLNIIMRATKDAQGDATKTAWSWTNMMKGVEAVIKSLMTVVGDQFTMIFQPFVKGFLIITKGVLVFNSALSGAPALILAVTMVTAGVTLAFVAASTAAGFFGMTLTAVLLTAGWFLALFVAIGAVIAGVILIVRGLAKWIGSLPKVQEALAAATIELRKAWDTLGRVFEKVKFIVTTALNIMTAHFTKATGKMNATFEEFVGEVIGDTVALVSAFANLLEAMITNTDRAFNIMSLTVEYHFRRWAGFINGISALFTVTVFGFNRTASDAMADMVDEMLNFTSSIDAAKKDLKDMDGSDFEASLGVKVKELGFQDLVSEFQKSQLGKDAAASTAASTASSATSLMSIDSNIQQMAAKLGGGGAPLATA